MNNSDYATPCVFSRPLLSSSLIYLDAQKLPRISDERDVFGLEIIFQVAAPCTNYDRVKLRSARVRSWKVSSVLVHRGALEGEEHSTCKFMEGKTKYSLCRGAKETKISDEQQSRNQRERCLAVAINGEIAEPQKRRCPWAEILMKIYIHRRCSRNACQTRWVVHLPEKISLTRLPCGKKMIRDVVARKWTKGRTGGQDAFEIRSLGSTNIWLL